MLAGGPGCSSGSRWRRGSPWGVDPPRGAKTVLLRPSIRVAGLAQRVAWLPLGRDERLGLHQLRLEASSCPAQELTAPDTEISSHRPRVP
jgi:hypothetical protein